MEQASGYSSKKVSEKSLTQEQRQEALLFQSLVQWFNGHPEELELTLKVLSNKRERDLPMSLTLLVGGWRRRTVPENGKLNC